MENEWPDNSNLFKGCSQSGKAKETAMIDIYKYWEEARLKACAKMEARIAHEQKCVKLMNEYVDLID